MSDRHPRSPDSAEGGQPRRPAHRPGPAIAAAAAVLAVLVVALVWVQRDDQEPAAAPEPAPATAGPTDSPTTPGGQDPSPVQTAEPSPVQTAETTQSPTPTDTAEAEPSATDSIPADPTPTAQNASAFLREYSPEGGAQVISEAADVTGDGTLEAVFASIVGDTVRIDVARWNGRFYELVFIEYGSPAERLDDLLIDEFAGDGSAPEIVTAQSSGEEGQSLSVWGWDDDGFRPQIGEGGCWDGSATYGVTGATISEGRIEASCDDSPLPIDAWSTDIYTWDGQSWVYEGSRTPSE